MPNLRVRPTAPDAEGRVIDITPQSAGWTYVGFEVRKLETGGVARIHMPGREICIMILTGSADIEAGGERFDGLGGRSSVFEDAAPGAVYAPAGVSCLVTARNACEVAVCSAPGHGPGAVRLIAPERMGLEFRGQGSNSRRVRNILPETEPAESLLITEVITPSGNWSSYPPHRHDEDATPQMTLLEETYYHRLDPPQGFAFQRVYTDDRSLDETVCVEDGDVVLVPRGYHPVGAPHGYDLYYLNVMAGPKRKWVFHNDPAHEWIVRGK
ncbi:5-deoxy-glucuronate isomerase [Caulobacter sp. S45]|uniref:5-deoxy-glucuronate isomerase n=1 Tax=Caulobacter sp. S45 TaxID=1641861 RepID=UPI00131ED129|nr:5-deoxy-glucuronate isomerase [Caulobacter sp. S45]